MSTKANGSILSRVIVKLSTHLESWVGVLGAPTTKWSRSKFETGDAPESRKR